MEKEINDWINKRTEETEGKRGDNNYSSKDYFLFSDGKEKIVLKSVMGDQIGKKKINK